MILLTCQTVPPCQRLSAFYRVIAMSNSRNTVNELIAGSVGGAAQVLVGQPLDTVKTRAQIAPSLVVF
jgi:hypothetical protein